jgi:acyl-CoA synthetase (NDP forming)
MHPVDIFFNPKSFAVIGASDNPKKGGNIVIQNLREFCWEGKIYPINPRGGTIAGLAAYESVLSVPDDVQLAMMVIPRDLVPQAMEECGKKGVEGVIISTAGFSDSGEEIGRSLEAEITDTARRYGMRVMGPNSIGTVNVKDGFVTSITTLEKPAPGAVSFFGQTGMFASGFFRWITSSQNFSVAKVACLGNKSDVDECDVLGFLGDDPATAVVGVYLEGVKDGRRFVETIRTVSQKKPVVALKSGRTERGAAAISSHTGSMAGEDLVYDGLFSSLGVLRVTDFDHFYDALKVFSFCPLPVGGRIGVVSITGVGCVLAADSMGETALVTPPLSPGAVGEMKTVFPEWAQVKNPVDMWFAIENVGPRRAYEVIMRTLIGQDDVDIIILIFTLIPESDFDAAEVVAGIRDTHPGKPVIACFMAGELSLYRRWYAAFEEKKIPVFPDPGRAVHAAWALVRYARFLTGTGGDGGRRV